jgi:hypothetical protein
MKALRGSFSYHRCYPSHRVIALSGSLTKSRVNATPPKILCQDLGVATGVGHAMSLCVPRPLALALSPRPRPAHVHEILTHQHHEVRRPFGSQVAAHEGDMCQFVCQALEMPWFIVDLCYTAKKGQIFALSHNSCP